jgi:hypothetical protein
MDVKNADLLSAPNASSRKYVRPALLSNSHHQLYHHRPSFRKSMIKYQRVLLSKISIMINFLFFLYRKNGKIDIPRQNQVNQIPPVVLQEYVIHISFKT